MSYGLTQSLDVESTSSQYASIADASQVGLDVTGALTIEIWVNLESLPGAGVYYFMAAKGGMSAISDTATQYGLRYDNDGSRRLAFFVRGTGVFRETVETVTLNTAQWYHIAGVYIPSTSITLFRDGVQVAQNVTTIPANLVNSASSFGVGADFAGVPTNFFDGKLSLCRVWDTNLSGATIAANMCNVYGTPTTNLQGEWSLNNVYTDASGNSNTLTSSGSPVFATDTPTTCASVAVAAYSQNNLTLLGVS